MRDKYSNTRRGVLLLLVLCILALFALVAVAFVLISGQSQRSAKNMQRMDQTLEDPQKLMNEAMMQVARGTINPTSVLGPHSLLEDMYGNNFVIASITGVSAVAGGQLIEFRYLVSSDNTRYPPSWNADPDPQHRLGCVLTFLDSSLMGESTRIVGRNPSSGNYQLLATGPVSAGSITTGTQVLINGTPFSGTGFGFNPATGKLDAWDPTGPDPIAKPGQEWNYALLPNPTAFTPNNKINYTAPAGPGGANEDYDAADFQNMLLAAQIVDPATGNVKTLPSLHRPALVNYWNTTRTSDWSNPDPAVQKLLHRKVILRPTQEYHPNFTGGNTNQVSPFGFDPVNGPWDVDNDGDGVADSVWVDLGLPVRAAKDGKLYKPLFAILCLDMDGRVNLNAHGSLTQTGSNYYTTTSLNDGTTYYSAGYFAGSTLPTLARGRGFGPADINPNYVLQNLTLYQRLLIGNGTLEGRYGADQYPGTAGSAYFSNIGVSPDTFTPIVLAPYNDYLSANKWFEFDGLYQNSATKQAAGDMKSLANFKVNGELPDPEGKSLLGVDAAGRPILQSLWGSYFLDLPYELNLGQTTNRGLPSPSATPDNPFSVSELERILRPFDRDAAQLPARLAALTSTSAAAPYSDSVLIAKRNEVTTESWDLPVYTAGLPTHILEQVRNDLAADSTLASKISWLPPRNVTDLLKAYYYYRLVTGGTAPATAATQADSMVNSMSYLQLTALFPPEMLAGLKMNINHPLPGPSNGSNSDTSAYNKTALWQSLGAGGSYGDFWFGQMPDYPDGTYDANNAPFAARQRYARYLYVLALLLRDPGGYAQWFTETAQREELTKRRIAQWAINAACFKVNDSIMVPFEYDLNPFDNDDGNANNDTWNVDGVIASSSTDNTATYRGLVWGCKPPEMILTETLAFHDRRIADTAWDKNPLDPGKNTTTQDTKDKDTDFDQTRIPQGSAFFELYCPRDLHGAIPPSDLYTYDSSTSTWFLNLGKMAPAGSGVPAYPVWRMVISERTRSSTDADKYYNNVYELSQSANYPDRISFEPEQYHDQSALSSYSSLSLLKNDTTLTAKAKIDRIVWFTGTAPTTNHYDRDRIYYNQNGTSTFLERGHYAVVGPRTMTSLGLTGTKTADCPLGEPSSQAITLAPTTSLLNNSKGVQMTDLSGNVDVNIDATKIKLPLGIIVSNYPTSWSTNQAVGISISEPLFSSASYYPQPTVAGAGRYEVRDFSNKIVKEWYGDPKKTDPAIGYFRNTPLDKESTRPLGDTSEKLPYAGTVFNYKTVFLQRLANPLAPYDAATNPYLTVDWMPIDLTIFNGEENSATTDPDAALNTITNPAVNFATRQRGKTSSDYNIWKPESDDPSNSAPADPQVYFGYNLVHSLGYLNKAFQPFITGSTLGYNGDPSTKPFPWLPWFGRPYVSQLELMLVPGSHPARLLWEFQPCSATADNYKPGDVSQAPFPQLLNFLQSGTGNGMNQFGRILDYVGVPSWYAGTEIQADPGILSPNGIPTSPGTHTFFPPYNRISTYREPGRINLNTIYSEEVFNGLMNGVNNGSTKKPSWTQFIQSRRKDLATAILGQNSAYPTEFSNPYRSCGGAFWDPLGGSATGIDATLLRPNATSATAPLFQYTSPNNVDNTSRNPFFHYSDLMRLGNLATTRSNVYSVWITVGYFEVKPNSFTTPAGLPDLAHPDGYELGQEMGSDTGEIVRHRAFYMIDRTVPVGFQRGQDLNVEKAIILKRFIE